MSTSNLISMAIKVALALFSSATSDGIDKSDVNTTQVSERLRESTKNCCVKQNDYILYLPNFQSILGIVISALTGSEDPSEVAVMAKQASEVIKISIDIYAQKDTRSIKIIYYLLYLVT